MSDRRRWVSGGGRSATVSACFGAAILTARAALAQAPASVKPPVVTHHVDAIYPPSALAERKDADVVLTVTIDADGHVSKVEVAESGGADLDEAAIVAAREWTFVPAMRGGKALASRIRMPFHFAPPAPAPELVEVPQGPGDVPVHKAVQPAPPSANPTSVDNPASAPSHPSRAAAAAPIEEVRVTGRALAPSRGASDFRFPVGELAAIPRANAAEFLKLAPGVLVTNEGGEGHADSLIVRGFDAGEGEAVETTVGGVPVNDPGNFHGNGYADTHFILPETIQSLRVQEGPFDPRQGNFAIAASADYELGLARRGLTAKQTVGSYGTERTVLTWGPEDEDARTFAAAEYARSDGYGQSRSFQRGSVVAQYEGKLGARGFWRVTGQAYSVVAQAAGVVREDDYDAGRIGFYGTYDPNQGQDSARYSVAADLETRGGKTTFGQQVFLISRTTRIREDFTGYVTDAGASEPRGTMLDLAVSEQSLGARGSARTQFQALGQTQEVEIGYFARGDAVDNVQRLIARATQSPYATDASLSGALGDFALYGDANIKPVPGLALRGGLREDLFSYLVSDRCPGLSDCNADPKPEGNPRTSQANTAVLPRGSAILGPFGGFTFVASYGQGVRSLAIDQVGSGSSLPTISSYEGGVSYASTTDAGALSLSSVFFGTHISRDEVFDPAVGRTVETGATTRAGWTAAGRFTGQFLDVGLNASAVRGVVDATSEAIPYVPHVMARTDAAIFADLPFRLQGQRLRASLGGAFTAVGVRSLPYGQTSAAYALADATLKLGWRAFELALACTNLMDAKVRLSEFTFASDFQTQPRLNLAPERAFTAGPPRVLFVSLSANFGR